MTDDEVLVSVNDSCVKNTLRTGSVGLIVGKLAASLFHRYRDFSCPRPFVPKNEYSLWGPGNESSRELSFPENESSRERKVPGTKVPGTFVPGERKVSVGTFRSWE